ncbi:MAG: hypothetical protein Q4A16_03330 [Lautropia sp.]|nr:hypothetical protein [Lautropia sp.]
MLSIRGNTVSCPGRSRLRTGIGGTFLAASFCTLAATIPAQALAVVQQVASAQQPAARGAAPIVLAQAGPTAERRSRQPGTGRVAASEGRDTRADGQRSEAPKLSVHAGLARLNAPSDVNLKGLSWLLWYPTEQTEQVVDFGRVTARGAWDAKPLPGKHPLIVFSHGSGGSALSHWQTARYLASKGYLVLTLVHPHDNVVDASGRWTLPVLQARPKDWSRALDTLLESRFGEWVDRQRIVAAGFAEGGYTALVVAGVRPSSLALDRYCLGREYPEAVCLSYDRTERLKLRFMDFVGMRRERLEGARDARVRAAIALAPPGSALFNEHSLSQLRMPVLLMQGSRDATFPFPNDACYVATLSGWYGDYRKLPGEHSVFMSVDPVTRENRALDGGLEATHQRIGAFLERALGNAEGGVRRGGTKTAIRCP